MVEREEWEIGESWAWPAESSLSFWDHTRVSTPRVVLLWLEAKGLHGAAGISGFLSVPLPVLFSVSGSFCFCAFLVA